MKKLFDFRSSLHALWPIVVLAMPIAACAVEDSGGPSVGDTGGTRDVGGGGDDTSGDGNVPNTDVDSPDVVFPDSGASAALSPGTYFVAVDTTILPGALIYMSLNVTVQGAGETVTAGFTLQPLRTDLDSDGIPRANARTPTGEPLVLESIPVADGEFSVELGVVTIPGDANAITVGADIVADLSLSGVALDDETLCGSVTGAVTQPIEIGIDGSTFGAVLFAGEDFTTIVEPLSECPN